jgi:hypothetical protein
LSDDLNNSIIGNYGWSPDGKTISFWFTDIEWENPINLLAILSIENQETLILCVEGRGVDEVIWSQNGRQLLINNYSRVALGKTLIADLELSTLPLSTKWSRGWMVPLPWIIANQTGSHSNWPSSIPWRSPGRPVQPAIGGRFATCSSGPPAGRFHPEPQSRPAGIPVELKHTLRRLILRSIKRKAR